MVLVDVVPFDGDLDVSQVEAVGHAGTQSEGLSQVLEACVGDAALVQVHHAQVIAESILSRDELRDGSSTKVTKESVAFE